MRLRLVANVRREQSKLDGLLANVCEHSRTFSFIERRACFVTWWSRLATAPDTPTYIVIHGGQSTGGVHPPNQFVPEIVSPSLCSPALVRHTLLIVYFFKELISFKKFSNATQLLIGQTIRFSQSEVVLHSILQILVGKYGLRFRLGLWSVLLKDPPRKYSVEPVRLETRPSESWDLNSTLSHAGSQSTYLTMKIKNKTARWVQTDPDLHAAVWSLDIFPSKL